MPTRLLVIGHVIPEPASSAAGERMMQLLRLFVEHDWEVTFACAAAQTMFSTDLSAIGVEQVVVELNNSTFDKFVQQLDPHVVLFDRFMTEEQFGWRVVASCPDAMRILDTEDLHFLRQARQTAIQKNTEVGSAELMSDTARREVASMYRCDLSLIVSTYESDLLRSVFRMDDALLLQIPLWVDTAAIHPGPCVGGRFDFEQREHFMTIGNFLHPPNWDSVQYLKKEIWPTVREQLPRAEMHVYGAYCSSQHAQLHDESLGFHVLGRADSAKEVIGKARVMLAPLRFGAGIKGKLLEAMRYGTPSVTTSVGAEAMHGDLPWNGIVADTAEHIAQAAVTLYTDRSIWESAQQNGWNIIRKHYAKDRYAQMLMDRITSIRADLQAHRQKNFIGSMLMYHTMRSAEFMSRWIELKNTGRNRA